MGLGTGQAGLHPETMFMAVYVGLEKLRHLSEPVSLPDSNGAHSSYYIGFFCRINHNLRKNTAYYVDAMGLL